MLLHEVPMLSAIVPLLTTFLSTSGSDEWPGWRGPHGSGVADGSPPIEWSESKNVRWKTPIPGRGLACPIVWGDRVYLTTAVGTGKKVDAPPPKDEDQRGGRGPRGAPAPIEEQDFVVLALERKSGAIVWQKKVATAMPHEGTHPDGTYASPTPTTDGERVYASFGSYGIYALTMAGELAWTTDLGDMKVYNSFGEGSSPVLCGDLLLVNWDHEGDSFLVALDKATGKERWRAARPQGTSWTTPLVVAAGDQLEIVVAGPRTVAYDVATGKELWHQGDVQPGGLIASPVALDELVLLTIGSRGGGEIRAVVAPAPADATKEGEPALWTKRADVPHVSSPLAYEGRVYFLKQNSGLISVLDATSGELVYGPERLEKVSDVYASPVAASGRLYIAGRDGTVEVLGAWPVETIGVNSLDDPIDASPAIAGDELFLRGRGNLYCIAEK
jgi:outer membrane protein assembly factor BamB